MAVLQQRQGLTGNQLKILAMVSMTLDHVGLQLLPQVPLLRILGRLALPIYGYMIAEGCRHTRDRRRYLLRIAALALLCQVVYFLALGSLYQSILVTFTLSICLICAAEHPRHARVLTAAVLLVIGFLCFGLPRILRGTDFAIDYGLWGVLLPAAVYFGKTKSQQLGLLALVLVMLALSYGGIQWFALAALPLLWLYNGRRGRRSIGRLFYWYYPAHLAVIGGIALVLQRL